MRLWFSSRHNFYNETTRQSEIADPRLLRCTFDVIMQDNQRLQTLACYVAPLTSSCKTIRDRRPSLAMTHLWRHHARQSKIADPRLLCCTFDVIMQDNQRLQTLACYVAPLTSSCKTIRDRRSSLAMTHLWRHHAWRSDCRPSLAKTHLWRHHARQSKIADPRLLCCTFDVSMQDNQRLQTLACYVAPLTSSCKTIRDRRPSLAMTHLWRHHARQSEIADPRPIEGAWVVLMGNSMKMVRRIQKINFCNNYVTGITGKLIICTLLCKKNYMVIYIRIDFVDIWIQARTWMRLEKTLLPNSSEVVRVK